MLTEGDLGHRGRAHPGLMETQVRDAACPAVVLDPRGGVAQDHARGDGPASSGTVAIAWAPRIERASSRVMGCPARCRNAMSTASVLVSIPYRSMIARTAASSRRMFVRTLAIHRSYTSANGDPELRGGLSP